MKARIWNHSEWVSECDPEVLMAHYEGILRRAGFGILEVTQHHFQPQGFTALFLLCESHFAIHTFPEEGRTYIELSSCNLPYFERAIELMNE